MGELLISLESRWRPVGIHGGMDNEQPEGDGERSGPGRLSRRLGAWLAVAASAAGVLAGVLIVIDRWGPKADFTIKEWDREANAACDRHAEFYAGLKLIQPMNQLASAPNSLPSDQFQNLRETIANGQDQVGENLRRLKSELDGIRRPKGYKAEVDQLIDSLNEESVRSIRFAVNLRQATDLAQAKAVYRKWQDDSMKPLQDQLALLEKLGAKQCYVEN